MQRSKAVEELRKVRCSEAEVREEPYMDAVSQDREKNLEIELRERPSTVNQLTHQMKELQEVLVVSLKISKDLETASCLGSVRAPAKP